MRKEELFEIIGEVDENKIAAGAAFAGEVLYADKRPRIIWFRVAATVAACLCLVFAGILFFRSEPNAELPAIDSEIADISSVIADSRMVIDEILENSSESIPSADSGEVITHYGSDSVEVEAIYPIPAPGEYFCEIAVTEAREHYAGEDVRYLLGFNIFKENEEGLSHEEKASEYQRLIDLGYELYERDSSSVVGMFTEEELENFRVNPDYGYFFYFVSNRNSSAVSIDEDDLITKYHWPDGYVME